MKANRTLAIVVVLMSLALTILSVRTKTQGGPKPSIEKHKVATLTSIPDGAEIILAAPWAKTKSKFGFVSNELYAADSEGKNLVRITHNNRHYNHFAVSPDRRMIAAVRYSSGDTTGDGKIDFRDRKTVWILDLEHKEECPLVPEYDAGWGGVDWSPDSQYVYFSIIRHLTSDIYRIRVDGTGFENITKGIEQVLVRGLTRKFVTDTGVSPDGRWIVFKFLCPRREAARLGLSQKSRLVMCRVDGTEPRFVTDGGDVKPLAHGPWGPGDFDPEFSPDGQYICFQRATDVATVSAAKIPSHDMMRIRIDGRGLERLSPQGNPAMHGIGDWSEDDRIVFTEWNSRDGYVGPVVVNADGSAYHRLNRLPRGGTHVRWIPPAKKASVP